MTKELPVFLGDSASAAPPHVLSVFVCYVWVRFNPTVLKTVEVVLPQVISVISVSCVLMHVPDIPLSV